ncbi:hypothetical protein DL546_009096 [Coniochaeta pulveracea]|uniref:Uncharacterized protein n=1 Tax=Coniochaeta pulveracea TaxID=177199 RepID=A0A420YII3_9PEZI|nr:hypothetical protein DL546_009096 [Coniochaeta pulveracea]
MSSTPASESNAPNATAHTEPTASEDDLVEVEQPEDEDGQQDVSSEDKPRKQTKPGEPAYVAPIQRIAPISPISPPAGLSVAPTTRPPLPEFVGAYLVGKTVDESGDIIDGQTGQVLARAGGDLPSIVGRQVSNNKGDILGDNGEILGYVEDLYIEKKPIPGTGAFPPLRTLADIMANAKASLMVDHLGNILDTKGNVVGKLHDNNNPVHRKEREEQERAKREAEKTTAFHAAAKAAAAAAASTSDEGSGSKAAPQQEPESERKPEQASGPSQPDPAGTTGKSEQQPPGYHRRTEEERRQNAQAWRKEAPNESPSDIFLDVKSTTEGIQLTIRIPTVFGNGQQVRPNISFS